VFMHKQCSIHEGGSQGLARVESTNKRGLAEERSLLLSSLIALVASPLEIDGWQAMHAE
jgi:hypothetical protein